MGVVQSFVSVLLVGKTYERGKLMVENNSPKKLKGTRNQKARAYDGVKGTRIGKTSAFDTPAKDA